MTESINSIMLSWLPRHLQGDPVVQAIMTAEANEIERYDVAWQDTLDQLHVETATWGLRYYEQLLGIPVEPAGQTYETRRSVIALLQASLKVSSGARFNDMLKRVTTSYHLRMDYSTGTLHISISFNPDDYLAEQLSAVIANIIPVHYDYEVEYEAFIVGISKAGDTL